MKTPKTKRSKERVIPKDNVIRFPRSGSGATVFLPEDRPEPGELGTFTVTSSRFNWLGICEGDTLIVDKTEPVTNGSMVLYVDDHGEHQIYRCSPILEDLKILGVLYGFQRRFVDYWK